MLYICCESWKSRKTGVSSSTTGLLPCLSQSQKDLQCPKEHLHIWNPGVLAAWCARLKHFASKPEWPGMQELVKLHLTTSFHNKCLRHTEMLMSNRQLNCCIHNADLVTTCWLSYLADIFHSQPGWVTWPAQATENDFQVFLFLQYHVFVTSKLGHRAM